MSNSPNEPGAPKRDISELRSQRWFDAPGIRSFNVRTRALQMGYTPRDFAGKPVIAILNTWSDFAQCHSHFKQRVEEVKRGVWQAGGLPMELPAMSLSETMVKPTTMLYRNFLAMETEELLRSHPVDGAVLMGGCDKTTPGLIMGAASMGLPAVFMPAGPMLTGRWRGQQLGSGSDNWKYWDERRAGTISEAQWQEMEGALARSPGHCMTMGTASTMTSMAEVLGLTLPGATSIPAADSAHARMASDTGRRIVDMVWENLRPADIVSRTSFINAVTVLMALGGSTNAVIHLVAMAGRLGIPLTLADFDEASRRTPVVCNLRPSGKYLMEDFYYAGGLRALLGRIAPLLDLTCRTVAGGTLGEAISEAQVWNTDVIRSLDDPVAREGGIAVLTGSLAPDGAVIKHSAASPELMVHTGPAVVFEDRDDLARRIDSPDLAVTPDSVLVMKNGGAVGAPGLPEWGALPVPKKLLAQGVRDMVRISDSRMSGTSFGTCVLHVSPEAGRGGPLALVKTGDMISLDVPARRIDLLVDADELARRREAWTPPEPPFARGYGLMFARHVTSADKGCDFDFLHAGAPTPEPKIY